jgi:hypothetical protein
VIGPTRSEEIDAEKPSRFEVLLVATLLAAGTAALLWCSLHRFLDNDELQHLNAAYFISRGERLYATFFESHFPLLYWLLQPVVRLCDSPAAMIVTGRLLSFALALATLLVSAVLARRAGGPRAAWIAPLLLLGLTSFFQKSLEIRPDVGGTLCLVVMLLVLSNASRERRTLWLVAGGAAFAAALWFTPKMVYAAGGAALAALLVFPAPSARGHAHRLSVLGWMLAGGAIVSGPMLLVMARLDILRAFLDSCLPANLAMRADHPAAARAFDLQRSLAENPATWVLGTAGLALVLARRGRWSNATTLILVLSFVAGFAGLFLNRVPLRQAHLTFMPQLAVLAGLGAAEMLGAVRRRWHPRAGDVALVALVALALGPPVRAVQRSFVTQELQTTVMGNVLAATQASDRVFDCWTGLYLTRLPAAYHYHLNSDVQRLLGPERIEQELMASLQRPEVTAVIRDRYLDSLPASVRSYIQDRFAPLPGCEVVLIRKR